MAPRLAGFYQWYSRALLTAHVGLLLVECEYTCSESARQLALFMTSTSLLRHPLVCFRMHLGCRPKVLLPVDVLMSLPLLLMLLMLQLMTMMLMI